MNQRLNEDWPVFLHLRADGSGTFGQIDQTFRRTRGADSAVATDPQQWIGVPTVSVEAGLAWAPNLPYRTTRVTLAYPPLPKKLTISPHLLSPGISCDSSLSCFVK